MRRLLLFALTCLVAIGSRAGRISAAGEAAPAIVLRGATVVVGDGRVLPDAVVVLRGG